MILKISLNTLNLKRTKKQINIHFGNFFIMIIKNHRSFICGVKGKVLSKKEIEFLKKYKPWGIILFKRNIGSIKPVSYTHLTLPTKA